MVPLMMMLLTTATLLLTQEAAAAVASQDARYDIRGNYLPETRRNTDSGSGCCIIPTCDEYGHCLGTLSCGYVCSQGRYPPVSYGVTRGYRLKEYYSKYDCKFGECKEYKFMCNHCPVPNDSDFSIYTVRSDCKNCYEQYL